jgi:hypothetical protein
MFRLSSPCERCSRRSRKNRQKPVFEMMSKRVLPLQEATPETVGKLQKERLQQSLEQLSASARATFNAGYFGEPPKAALTGLNP